MKPAMTKTDLFLIASSSVIGFAGLSFHPALSPLVLAIPVLWTLADTRCVAFAVVLAYKLAASRGLLPGAAVFLSENHTPEQAVALYFLMSLGASLPFLLFWIDNKRRKPVCLILAFLTAYALPPFSLIGIINPLMASGTIFRGWGFAGMLTVLVIYMLCAVSRKAAYSFLCVIALFTVLLGNSWCEMSEPEGIMAVDTSFGRLGSGSFNFTRDYERARMVFDDLRRRDGAQSGAEIVILPETIAGRLNDTGLELWKREFEKLFGNKTTVLFGAELPTGDGRKYDNTVLMFRNGEITVSRQRIPVPWSMYRGPFAKTGANLHLGDNGVLSLPDGRKAAIIICYETFLTWPYLASMIHSPNLIISTANLWWCRDTSLPATQRAVVSLWALTFGVPAVFVRNI
jgi:apolipoprotein N-acyltransferase